MDKETYFMYIMIKIKQKMRVISTYFNNVDIPYESHLSISLLLSCNKKQHLNENIIYNIELLPATRLISSSNDIT